jgi:ergothioneine biosynthesis protein EgtB
MDNCVIRDLLSEYDAVRKKTEEICQPLTADDYMVQAMPDVSPIKWHLAHTSWFFETFVLLPYSQHYSPFNDHYHFLFNSYYQSLGPFFPRAKRGCLSRPSVEEIYRYCRYVNEHMHDLNLDAAVIPKIYDIIQLGIHHEQQHQELMLMDIKYNFAVNPLRPAYLKSSHSNLVSSSDADNSGKKINFEQSFTGSSFAEGIYLIGWGGNGFAFDNEKPQHKVFLKSFEINHRLVTNGEFLEFILAGGYQNSNYWLSDGWQIVNQKKWHAPLYWEKINNAWWYMTLHGLSPLDPTAPVCHVSFYEADAYARWAKARLPLEAEWEVAASSHNPNEGNFLESGYLQPIAASHQQATQFFGDLWEWTQSPYVSFPGFEAFAPPFNEYNGKFACNQFVLKGGCAITPKQHIRLTYRNFYYPYQRWPFTGIRLARSL